MARGQFSDAVTGQMEGHVNWTAQVFESGGIPYFEPPEQFIKAYDTFLERSLCEQLA